MAKSAKTSQPAAAGAASGKAKSLSINIGISDKDRAAIAQGLAHLLADKASDENTADLLTQRLTVHEQAAWMLRSLLQD